ncbi:MAG: DEAD-box ATP-dependent helicase CshA, partial [Myxococcaceae bacterium]|nr:DEAD-box ATP-dependent helicase CshA [Myxococcaceae bacterium]
IPLSPQVRRAIDELGFTTPTAVQRAAFEPAGLGHDMIVQSRTGTGKTLAFGLPLVDRLVFEGHGLQALILAPTRELALQSQRAIEAVGKYKNMRTVAVYGGAPIDKQVTALKQGAEIVSGTPGRVLDLIKRGSLDPTGIRVLVLDEADEMFSMGFAKELNAIMDALPTKRQLLCFSATIDGNVQRMAERRMTNPQFIALSSDQVGAASISHFFYMVMGDKLGALIRVLEVEDPESAIIFCNTKAETETVARHLCSAGFNADWLNGDLPQGDREKIMKATREGKLRYMVATDVAARGIDISHLTHVINFGFPESAEQYVHRTGRTGRAGRTGTAISVLGPSNLGALYYLRLTFKIFPIERSLPSATELKTRQEADRLALLTEAFKGGALDEHRETVRRLLTHADAERVLTGLVRSFFASVGTDLDETAAATRRERSIPPATLQPERVVEPERVREPQRAAREAQPARGVQRVREPELAREPVLSLQDEDVELDDASDTLTDVGPSDSSGRRRKRKRRGREGQIDAPEEIRPLANGHAQPAAQLGEHEPSEPVLPEEPSPELENIVTLYFNVGKRDGLEARDLAELLTSSCELGNEDIGRVRVKERHTFVGVPTERADGIIAVLEGQLIRNRPLHVERAKT